MNTTGIRTELPPMAASTLHWADYLVFVVVLCISSAVGLFYGVAKRSKTTEDFLMAGRSMPLLPVAMSLFVSWLSAISFVGDPVEVYNYGIVYWLLCVGYCLALPLVAHVFGPVFYRSQLTSVYQYLKERYNVHVRTFGTVINGVGTAVYLGIALYAPCLALGQMSGLETWIAIVIVGVVCTFYTSLGGMKAVLWADTIQMVVMFGGLVVLLLVGGAAAGGPAKIYQVALQGGRINFNSFDPDPTRRNTVWTYIIGGFFRVLTPYISVQIFVQRYCTVKSEKSMKIAMYLNIAFFLVFITLFALIGLVLYAYYHECDPLLDGRIKRRDQLIPLLVMETMGFMPGVPGLYLACIVSASLSTLSSGQSALATTCLKDVVEPLYHKIYRKNLREKIAMVFAIVLSIFFGMLTIFMALMIYASNSSTIFGLTLTLQGAFSGPVAGLFCLGILFSGATTLNALIGGVVGISVSLWLAAGSFFDRPPPNPLDALPLSDCTTNISTLPQNTIPSTVIYTTLTEVPDNGFRINQLYGLSPPLFSAVGLLLTLLCGILAMVIERIVRRCKEKTPGQDKTNPEEMKPFKET